MFLIALRSFWLWLIFKRSGVCFTPVAFSPVILTFLIEEFLSNFVVLQKLSFFSAAIYTVWWELPLVLSSGAHVLFLSVMVIMPTSLLC